MTETTISTTTDRRRGRAGVAALWLAAGATLGIAGTVLATVDDETSRPPTVVQPLSVNHPASAVDRGESSCQLMAADAAERCMADRAVSACHALSADAAERCVADGAGSG